MSALKGFTTRTSSDQSSDNQVSENEASVNIVGPIKGSRLSVGDGFTGTGFRYGQFEGQMDPLIMVDH
ncbi:hypothetical protein [Vibrio mexicanus]|uniref:hypothetical protein n=1 Tax=Vibrio mexicanus TaxID=1004326 RepID=UPI000A5C4ECA|nr:hypothetical protein [Vibrio mexicanus]